MVWTWGYMMLEDVEKNKKWICIINYCMYVFDCHLMCIINISLKHYLSPIVYGNCNLDLFVCKALKLLTLKGHFSWIVGGLFPKKLRHIFNQHLPTIYSCIVITHCPFNACTQFPHNHFQHWVLFGSKCVVFKVDPTTCHLLDMVAINNSKSFMYEFSGILLLSSMLANGLNWISKPKTSMLFCKGIKWIIV